MLIKKTVNEFLPGSSTKTLHPRTSDNFNCWQRRLALGTRDQWQWQSDCKFKREGNWGRKRSSRFKLGNRAAVNGKQFYYIIKVYFMLFLRLIIP